MWRVIDYVAKFILRLGIRRALFNRTMLYAAVLIAIVLLCSNRASAANYEYKGVFPTQNVIMEFCDDCWLELPPDFLTTNMVLNVTTDDHARLFKAMQKSAAGQGWNLTRQGNILKAEPLQNVGSLVYISCMDNQPHNVEKYLYAASIKADSIQCAKRDSVTLRQQIVTDSLAARSQFVKDSLSKIPPLEFGHYELRYYAYSKSFTDKIGIEWNQILAEGNLHNRFKILDSWRLFATENNDTTYNERRLVFSLDTAISVDWGSEEQTMQKSYLTDGIVTQDYEWRKYGLIVKIARDGRRVKLDYTFRDKDNSVSVLQGSVVGNDTDTLRLFGDYMAKREVNNGLPWLTRIPILNWFVATQQTINDLKGFELYLVPITSERKNEYGRVKENGQLYKPERREKTDTTNLVAR